MFKFNEKKNLTKKRLYWYSISKREEFFGHASNLQAWVESDYDSRILHRNLSFPLLKKLTELGDKRASVRLQEEIVKRIQENFLPVTQFLVNEKYLSFLEKDQFKMIEDNNILKKALKSIEDWQIFPLKKNTFEIY